MRLSLRSLSSFFFSSFDILSASFVSLRVSLSDFISILSLSDCRFFREVDPRKKLSTEDFFCVELGVAGEDKLVSAVEIVDLTRSLTGAFLTGDMTGGDDDEGCSLRFGGCAICDEDLRKNGIEDGVRRRVELPRRTEEDGLSGACAGARPP